MSIVALSNARISNRSKPTSRFRPGPGIRVLPAALSFSIAAGDRPAGFFAFDVRSTPEQPAGCRVRLKESVTGALCRAPRLAAPRAAPSVRHDLDVHHAVAGVGLA